MKLERSSRTYKRTTRELMEYYIKQRMNRGRIQIEQRANNGKYIMKKVKSLVSDRYLGDVIQYSEKAPEDRIYNPEDL